MNMAETLRVGIIGAGWPGQAHAKGYAATPGFKLAAVADLIPERRQKLMAEVGIAKEFTDAKELLEDREIDVVSVCLPNHLHAPTAIAALKAGKHVLCERPPALSAAEAKKIQKAAEKAGKVLLYGFQRRFGGGEQAAKQAVEKGYAGEVYHARASWMRTRGIPRGTGWFTDKSKSGGGAIIDLGLSVLDLAWWILGQPVPLSVSASLHQRFGLEVEDAGFALMRFEGGKSLELAASWAINQPPQQQGTGCRLFGQQGTVDVYTSQGAMIYRPFNEKGDAKVTPLKPPKVQGHVAMIRHFRQCILGQATPSAGPAEGLVLMRMIDAIYKSAATGKSVEIK
jgi:predicted dehydrogenase